MFIICTKQRGLVRNFTIIPGNVIPRIARDFLTNGSVTALGDPSLKFGMTYCPELIETLPWFTLTH
jgi:hypothetical protein